MSAEYSGLQGSNIAGATITTTADPNTAVFNSRFQVSAVTSLGTGKFSVKLAQKCDAGRRVITTSASDGNFLNEDRTVLDDEVVVFQITSNAGLPAAGVAQFIVMRTVE